MAKKRKPYAYHSHKPPCPKCGTVLRDAWIKGVVNHFDIGCYHTIYICAACKAMVGLVRYYDESKNVDYVSYKLTNEVKNG